jgi:hypothetical protein
MPHYYRINVANGEETDFGNAGRKKAPTSSPQLYRTRINQEFQAGVSDEPMLDARLYRADVIIDLASPESTPVSGRFAIVSQCRPFLPQSVPGHYQDRRFFEVIPCYRVP